jgi:metallo-beta-lactamase family protein
VDAVVLSHAHIDHSGNLPVLMKDGFRGRVHGTAATRDLCGVMLRDSARIQVRDVSYLQRKGREAGEPLYTAREVTALMRRFRGHGYGEWIDVARGIRARFRDAGHILGAASVHLEIREAGGVRRVTFTGDLGRPGMPILRDPEPLDPAEVLITESTYGGRCHDAQGDLGDGMKRALKEALELAWGQGGKLIIPAFAVGRTQSLLYYLSELMEEGSVRPTKVFLDSPLGIEATQVVMDHPECFDEATMDRILRAVGRQPAMRVEFTRTVEDSKRINRERGTCVVIAASGMCEFGRILHHLRRHLGDPQAVVAFVGYQAVHTLGRRIVEHAPRVRIYGEEVPVRARVVKLNGFSAHADRDELLAELGPLAGTAGQTFVVHGEEDQALALAGSLQALGFQEVAVPHEGQSFDF